MKLNLADNASRGISADSLVIEEKWSKAPNFLFKPEEQLPKDTILISDKSITENEPEVNKIYRQGLHHTLIRFKK